MTQHLIQLPEKTAAATFGFLNVLELPALGYCGGLLVVSSIGRPLEFHCTTPVRPNRTQQIMYGQTYLSYLFSDQIGTALVDKIKQPPAIFVTQSPDLLPISEAVDAPVMLQPESNKTPFDGRGLKSITVHDRECWYVNVPEQQIDRLEHHVLKFTSRLPLDEPFERIAQAIEEAHAVIRAA